MEGQQVEQAAGDEGDGRRAEGPQPGRQRGHQPRAQQRQGGGQLPRQPGAGHLGRQQPADDRPDVARGHGPPQQQPIQLVAGQLGPQRFGHDLAAAAVEQQDDAAGRRRGQIGQR